MYTAEVYLFVLFIFEKSEGRYNIMKYKNTLLAVKDMKRSIAFYKEVLGLHVIMDFGANVTLTGGLCLQTLDSWSKFINTREIFFGGRECEVYFEEDDFDKFVEKIDKVKDLKYVHRVIEHRWGQRAVRFYDPDMHIIEVGENMKSVCRRFIDSGLTAEETAKRMDVPIKYVNSALRGK